MYHLFNSVYVDTERRVMRDVDNITISPHIGYEYFPGPNEKAGRQIGYARTLDEVEPQVLMGWLKEAMQSENKTFIFCDGPTYLRLYTMLVKCLVPQIDLETFRWVWLCKKATFNTSLTNWKQPGNDALGGVVINNQTILDLAEFEDPLQPYFNELMAGDDDVVSLEWHIFRLAAVGYTGIVPKRLKNILRRIALANTHDALDVWGRVITDPENWEYAGADLDTLLNAPSVFEGALNMHYTNNPIFLKPGLFVKFPQDKWLCSLLEELQPLLERIGEGPTAKRTTKILAFLKDQNPLSDSGACLQRCRDIFTGPDRLAMPNRDSSKYDENLIRYILSRDQKDLARMFEGATW
ncbi:hypothetical protein [Streptomyces sp. CHB9.2]|uniref:hypothetical protein n=1 Tax=Streptomyces sp. CHB9.2 TaxID=2841670 RepID=UPI002094A6E3|nr:hypothetical protein [Streptomyces sp. CHB9.2]MCO6704826.1 hypothetical protein [Streptomyces sp. CHB9.2]